MNTHDQTDNQKQNQKTSYQIQLLGEIDQERIAWFEAMGFRPYADQGGSTTVTGEVKDQAHLRGILNRIWDLNFTLIRLERLEKENRRENHGENDQYI